MQQALVLELPKTTNDVEGTILKKLKQIGYNPETQGHVFWRKNTVDGFYVLTMRCCSEKNWQLFKAMKKTWQKE